MKTIYSLIGEVTYKLMRKRKRIKRVVASLLTVCIVLSNLQGLSFIAWGAEAGGPSFATPSSAEKATDSNAILIPEKGVGRGELLEEAAKAVKSGQRFELDSLVDFGEMADSEEALIYQDLFGDGVAFLLFADNGDGGRFRNSKDDKAYAYAFLRLTEEDYLKYTEQSDDTYFVTGEEDLVFLYVNGTEDERQFSFNINGVEVPVVTLAGFSAGGKGPGIATPSVSTPNASPSNAGPSTGGSSNGGSSNDSPSDDSSANETSSDGTEASVDAKEESTAGTEAEVTEASQEETEASQEETETSQEETETSQEETASSEVSIATPSVARRMAPANTLAKSRHLVSVVSSALPIEGEIDEGDEIFPGYLDNGDSEETHSFASTDGEPVDLPQTEVQMKREAASPKVRLLRLFTPSATQANSAIGGTVMKLGAVSPNASYHKKIQNLGDNRYRLYLDIAGGSQKGLDLVLVLDTSGSMGSGYGNGIKTLKNVLTGTNDSTGFIQNFLQNDKNELSIVTFASEAKTMSFNNAEWVSSSELNTVVSKVRNLTATGGTNYEDALFAAQELLKEKKDDGKDKYVVFLSDGAPTYYNASRWEPYTDSFEGSAGSSLGGSGSSTTDRTSRGTNYAINAFKTNNQNATVYTVGFTTSSEFIDGYLRNLASSDAYYMTANNNSTDSLQSAFDKISTKLALESVKISDTLSDNVQFAAEPKIEVYKTDTNGKKTILENVRPNVNNKSIEADFGNLDLGSVYTLAFDIELTEEAVKKYNESKSYDGFADHEKGTGGQETNYDTNTHSENEFGLWTNQAATVTYTFEGGTVTEEYQKPVAQVNAVFTGPEYYKKILDNGDGTYDLELSVTPYNSQSSSTVVTKTPVDVVFVVDNSGSMDRSIGNGDWTKRKTVLNNILYDGFKNSAGESVEGIIEQMLKRDDDGNKIYDIQIAGCRYGSRLGTTVTFTDDFDTTKYFKCNASGGNTNCAAGLEKGISLINGAREGAVKYLIFMTDGEPNEPDNAKESAYKKMSHLSKDTHFYAIRISKSGGKTFLENLRDRYSPNSEGSSTYIDGSDTNKLQTEFTKILDNIIQTTTTSRAITNVKITDTLSQYADMVTSADKVEFRINGTAASEAEKDEAIKSIGYNKATKQLTVEFKPEYKLKDDTTYSVRFKVRPSEAAYTEYAANGYNAEGDSDTDIDISKITSSGKPGFRTNDKASLEYQYNGKTDTREYLHPVLQVKEADLSYEKLIRDNRDGTYDLTLDVTPNDTQTSVETSEPIPVDLVFVVDVSNSMLFTMKDWDDPNRPAKENRRIDTLNPALESMADNLLGGKYDVRIAGVTFSHGVRKQIDFTNNSESVKNTILHDGKWSDGGTDSYAGLKQGITYINRGSTDHKDKDPLKYLVFMTDGEATEPTVEGKDNIPKKAAYDVISGQNTSSLNRNGIKLNKDVTFYSIRISEDAGEDFLTTLANKHDGPSQYFDGNTEKALTDIFAQIESKIISTSTGSLGVTGAQIKDTLSEYAEFVGNPEDITLEVNGKPATDAEKARILASASYDETTHTVTAKFNPGYTLEDGTTYTIRFKIKPSEAAYQEYNANYIQGKNPYGTTVGDEGTDAPGNNTSSGEPGFYSNDEATLTYSYAGVKGEKTYLKPVIQVAIAKVRFVKHVDSENQGDVEEFIVKLEGVNEEDGNYAVVLPKEIRSAPIEFYMSDENKKFKVYEVIPKEYDLKNIKVVDTLTEEELPDRYADGTLTVRRSDDITVVVTNTYHHEPYFHSRSSVTNNTTGDKNEPFERQSQTPPGRPVADAVSYEKNKVVFRTLEEDEPLAK